MKKKFLIIAPEYNENNGGIVAQHKLCDILNSIGHESYIHPFVYSRISTPNHRLRAIYEGALDDLKLLRYRLWRKFKTNPIFKTPLITNFKNENTEDWIVIYPEVVTGNPLGGKNIVRWLMHQPGYFSKIVCYGRGEIYYKYADNIKDFSIDGSKTSANLLKIVHYPTEHYNMEGISTARSGTAYCIRKGKNKSRNEIPPDAILIDGLSHQEISKIFKRVKIFISCDDYTAYTWFALMCGCICVVIPSEGITEEQWHPNIEDRHGIAYGTARIDWAKKTAATQLDRLNKLIKKNEIVAKIFAMEAIEYFSAPRDSGYHSIKKQ